MTENTTQSAAPIWHHFVVVLQTADGRIVTQDGTAPLTPGVHTRESVYDALTKKVADNFGVTGAATVTFFSLAPNAI